MTNDILVAKQALEDNEEAVVDLMKKVGNTSQIMTEEAYITWEIFREMRKKRLFRETFEQVFLKPFNEDPIIDNENIALE